MPPPGDSRVVPTQPALLVHEALGALLAILLIDKHVTALSRIADRHYIIAKGQVVWSGTSEALRANAPLRQRYLGV